VAQARNRVCPMTTDDLVKLCSKTNLWVQYAQGVWNIYYVGDNYRVGLTNNPVIFSSDMAAICAVFIAGFKSALVHVNGVEL
jgi:hypothetical protein